MLGQVCYHFELNPMDHMTMKSVLIGCDWANQDSDHYEGESDGQQILFWLADVSMYVTINDPVYFLSLHASLELSRSWSRSRSINIDWWCSLCQASDEANITAWLDLLEWPWVIIMSGRPWDIPLIIPSQCDMSTHRVQIGYWWRYRLGLDPETQMPDAGLIQIWNAIHGLCTRESWLLTINNSLRLHASMRCDWKSSDYCSSICALCVWLTFKYCYSSMREFKVGDDALMWCFGNAVFRCVLFWPYGQWYGVLGSVTMVWSFDLALCGVFWGLL